MIASILNTRKLAITLAIVFLFVAGTSFAAWSTSTWHGTDWIQPDSLISAQKVAENFEYLLGISGSTCTTHNSGRVRYEAGAMEYCDGSSWVSLTSWVTSPWGSCAEHDIDITIPGNLSCGRVWVGPCSTPILNICDAMPAIEDGDQFKITTDVTGSDWVHSPNMRIRTYTFTKGVAATDHLQSSGRKRNNNWRIYDGGCLVYGKTRYSGDRSNYKWSIIKITNLHKVATTESRTVQCMDGTGSIVDDSSCTPPKPEATIECTL